MTSESKESIRYEQLLQVMDKALSTSQDSLDRQKVIDECYGADAKIFGSSTLTKLLEGVMERVNSKAKGEVTQYLETRRVAQTLARVEKIIHALELDEQQNKAAEQEDYESATQALQNAKLPDSGLTPNDLIAYHAHQVLDKEKLELKQALLALEQETTRVQEQIAQAEKTIAKGIAQVEATGSKLERTADACSFVA